MGILQELGTGQGYLKAGFLGFNKSGKTFTAIELAIGTREFFGLTGPIAFFDTEGGSEYRTKRIERATGRKCVGVRSRALGDLLEASRECEAGAVSVLVVDSMTHIWREVCEAYLKQVNDLRARKRQSPRTFIEFQDWKPIKAKFGEWTDFYTNSELHIIICGRAGFDWDYEVNEDGKRELIKTGVKMKTETEFGFEPRLLVEMERIQKSSNSKKLIHRATVIGDCFDVIDAAVCDNPTWEFFKPVLEQLKPGAHAPIDMEAKTDLGIDEDGNDEWRAERKRRVILYEKIQGELMRAWPGTTKDEKTAKANALEWALQTRSWTEVESMNSDKLRAGLEALEGKVAAHMAEAREGK